MESSFSDSGGVADFLFLLPGVSRAAPLLDFFLEDITAVAVLANVAELESSSLRDLYLRSEVKCRVERALIHARACRGPAADWCMLRATDVLEFNCPRLMHETNCSRWLHETS